MKKYVSSYSNEASSQRLTRRKEIVELFQRFSSRCIERIGLSSSLTPRELQQALRERIPERGRYALEDLVTCFEKACYSDASPTEQDLEIFRSAVKTLNPMIEQSSVNPEQGTGIQKAIKEETVENSLKDSHSQKQTKNLMEKEEGGSSLFSGTAITLLVLLTALICILLLTLTRYL